MPSFSLAYWVGNHYFRSPDFLTVRERDHLEEAEGRGCVNVKFLPLTWCCQLVQSARDEGFIDTEPAKEALVKELLNIQQQCDTLLKWHQYNVPLIYTQVSRTALPIIQTLHHHFGVSWQSDLHSFPAWEALYAEFFSFLSFNIRDFSKVYLLNTISPIRTNVSLSRSSYHYLAL